MTVRERYCRVPAWCFFVGTIMYVHGPLEGGFFELILQIWVAGSCAFTLGSLFLGEFGLDPYTHAHAHTHSHWQNLQRANYKYA